VQLRLEGIGENMAAIIDIRHNIRHILHYAWCTTGISNTGLQRVSASGSTLLGPEHVREPRGSTPRRLRQGKTQSASECFRKHLEAPCFPFSPASQSSRPSYMKPLPGPRGDYWCGPVLCSEYTNNVVVYANVAL